MIQELTPHQAQELIASGNVDVVDVRESHEWIGGHLPGAKHVPLDRFRASPHSFLPRDGVVFVCAAGIRSQTAARIAAASGFKQLYNLTGGTRAWSKAGLPIQRDASAA